MAALPEDPSETLPRDPSEVALRAFVRARGRGDEAVMTESWRQLLTLELPRFTTMVKAKRHPDLPGGRVPPEDVDVVVHEAFLRLYDWLKLEGTSLGEVRAIMRSAVGWAVLDHLDLHVRHEGHRAGSFDEDDPTGEGPAAFVRRVEEELADRLNDPFEEHERSAAVGAALADLPETQRHVVVLRLGGHRSKEVAEQLGLEPSNVDQIFSRGLRRLQAALKDLR